MLADSLRKSILQAAIEGKLTQREPGDGDARGLLAEIQKEKARLVKEGKIRRSAPLPPVADDEIPFDIPDNWRWVRLGEICKNIFAGGDKPQIFSKMKSEECSIPVLSNGRENDGIFGWTNCAKVFENAITVSGRGTIGYSKLRTQPFYPIVRLLVLITIEISLKYLEFVLNLLLEQGTGTSIQQLTVPMIIPKLIPLPPLAEQRRIVARLEERLSCIDDIEKAQKQLDADREVLRKSLLQAAIEGKLTRREPGDGDARELLAEIQKEKSRLVKEGKIRRAAPLPPVEDDEIPFDIPENWCWVRLGECTFNHGQKVPDRNFTYIDIGSINNKENKLGMTDNILSPQEAPSRARKIVFEGDVIYATVRPYLHNACVIDKRIEPEPIVSTGFAVLSMGNPISNRYLLWVLLSPMFDRYANDTGNSKGVAYPAINDNKLLQGLIPLPPLAEQRRIVAQLEGLLPLVDELGEMEKELSEL